MSALFTLNSSLEAQLLESVVQSGIAMDVAQEIAAEARATAPVDSGTYRDSITVEETKHGARVVANDKISSMLEFGIPSRGIAPKFTLRNAAASLGYKFKRTSR